MDFLGTLHQTVADWQMVDVAGILDKDNDKLYLRIFSKVDSKSSITGLMD